MRKKLYISGAIFSVIFFNFLLFLPDVMAEMDKRRLLSMHKSQSVDFTIESQAKDIPLVSRIHKIYDFIDSDNSNITSEIIVEATEQEKISIYNEIQELIDKEILIKNQDGEIKADNSKLFIKGIYSGAISNLKEYIIDMSNQEMKIWLDLETEKILFVQIIGEGGINLNTNNEKVLTGFLSYLNLDLLEDWSIEEDLAESKEAKLIVALEAIEEFNQGLLIKIK